MIKSKSRTKKKVHSGFQVLLLILWSVRDVFLVVEVGFGSIHG